MKSIVLFADFRQAFFDHGRGEQFSKEGLEALYDYLCDCEDDTGEEIELDVIAFCCEFSEHSKYEAQDIYGDNFDEFVAVSFGDEMVITHG